MVVRIAVLLILVLNAVAAAQPTSQIAALSRILAAIATQLDTLEKRAAELRSEPNIHAEIARRQPLALRSLSHVQDDLQRLDLGAIRLGSDGQPFRVILHLDHFLSVAHAKYDSLKAVRKDDPHIPQVDAAFDSLFQRRRLRPIISAVARTGVAFADMKAKGSFDVPTSDDTGIDQLMSSTSVLWETAHWGHGRADISIRGQVGVAPVAAPYALGNAPTQATLVRQQAALFYEAYFAVNFVKAQVSEFGVFGGGGQSRLWSPDVPVDDSAPPTNVLHAERRSAYYRDMGFEYRMYGVDSRIAHHDKSLLSPVLRLSVGVRWNERFFRTPHCGCKGVPNRRFLRLGVDLRQVLDRRNAESEKQETFGFRIVGQREWGGDAPDVNLVVLEVDVSLSNLFPGMPGLPE